MIAAKADKQKTPTSKFDTVLKNRSSPTSSGKPNKIKAKPMIRVSSPPELSNSLQKKGPSGV
jgi:hypothetical protein